MTTTTEQRSFAIKFLNLSSESLVRAERTIDYYTRLAYHYGLAVPEIAEHAHIPVERVQEILAAP